MLTTMPRRLLHELEVRCCWTDLERKTREWEDVHEADNGCDFDGGKCKLGLAVALDPDEVDDGDEYEENGDKDGLAQMIVPVLDRQCAGYNLQRQGE